QVLSVVAGVFFFLPSLAMAFFVTPPELAESMTNEQAMAVMAGYYEQALPFIIVAGVAQAIGVLALLALLTDRRRPTVGEALKAGVQTVLPYVAALLLVGLGVGLALVALAGIVAATGVIALALILAPLGMAALFYVFTKTSLVAPVLVIEGVRNPVTAISRSWTLTKGNSLRLFWFYALVFIVFLVLLLAVSLVIGLLVSVILGEGPVGIVIEGAASGALGALMVVFFASILAAVHRQLAGPSAETISATFD
ncbi:MAG: hypothetical protein AB7U34_03665, partial [Novosphingobium sp.]